MITYKTNIDKLRLVRDKADFKKVKIGCSKDMFDFVKQFFHDDITIYESFFLILLNQRNNTIGYVKISQGGINGTLVDVRIVCKYAIEALATSVIFCHNHPSGNVEASENDKKITKKLIDAFALLDIKVLDHLIITETAYLSFSDEYML